MDAPAMRLYQKSLDELARKSLAARSTPNVEFYRPTDQERAQGNWAVVFSMIDEDGQPDLNSTAHLIPILDGRGHRLSADCACGPVLRADRDCWEHNALQ